LVRGLRLGAARAGVGDERTDEAEENERRGED